MKNTLSRTISGIVAFGFGVLIIYLTVRAGYDVWSKVWGVFSGGFIGAVGVYLFFNKKEDDIEEIKNKEE